MHLLSIILLSGCGPSQEEIQQMIMAENTELREELVAADVIDSEEEKRQAAEAEAAKPDWEKSMDFLAKLNELMANYEPALPDEVDNTDLLACTTKHELTIDAELKKGAKSLFKQKKASEKARERKQREFERAKWIQYGIDYEWQTREIERPAKYACWRKDLSTGEARWDDADKSTCDRWNKKQFLGESWTWKVKVQKKPPIGYYSKEEAPYKAPVLMSYIDENSVTVPPRFHCLVTDVEKGKKDQVYIYCKGDKPKGSYIKAHGDLRALHKGDAVSVPLKDSKRHSVGVVSKLDRKVGYSKTKVWVIDADAASVTLDNPATCPTKEEILAGAAKKDK